MYRLPTFPCFLHICFLTVAFVLHIRLDISCVKSTVKTQLHIFFSFWWGYCCVSFNNRHASQPGVAVCIHIMHMPTAWAATDLKMAMSQVGFFFFLMGWSPQLQSQTGCGQFCFADRNCQDCLATLICGPTPDELPMKTKKPWASDLWLKKWEVHSEHTSRKCNTYRSVVCNSVNTKLS